ncbi:MAG: DsrE family protein [Rhodobacterales bacterium]|nr:DsrE family protein [Rhodobacterales bacterium]
MTLRLIAPALLALSLLSAAPTPAAAAENDGVHRVVIHVDENDPARMNLALNNAANLDSYYKDKGEEVEIEIVAYGPGLNMLVAGKSPVADRIKSFGQNFDNIGFKACGNTHKKMSKKAGKDVALLPEAQMVTAGVVYLIERQEEGWSYIRP